MQLLHVLWSASIGTKLWNTLTDSLNPKVLHRAIPSRNVRALSAVDVEGLMGINVPVRAISSVQGFGV